MNEQLTLGELESRILEFIDKQTWDKTKPKFELYKEKGSGLIVDRRIKVRWGAIQFLDRGKRRFTKNDHNFERAIYKLKKNKLITSRTKCQKLAGLSCTSLGHNLANILSKHAINKQKKEGNTKT